MHTFDKTPGQTTRSQARPEIRPLRDVMLSCDKLSVPDIHGQGASLESVGGAGAGEVLGSTTAWVATFHEKIQAGTPLGSTHCISSSSSGSYSTVNPAVRHLDFNTPVPAKPSRPSPTVSSVMSDRWCLESMTPNMRFTPPNMTIRGMRMMNPTGPREGFGAYKITETVRKEDGRGMSLCILPTPLLRANMNRDNVEPFKVFESASPAYGFSRPSPNVGNGWKNMSPTPIGPVQKKYRQGYNSRHFPIPRPSSDSVSQIPARKLSVDLG
jgi:hypothetical protein